MLKVFRFLYASLAGIAIAFSLVIATELFSSVVHPFPPDFTHTMDEVCQHVARYPHWILGVVLVIWTFTSLFSTWVATQLGNVAAGLFVGALLLAAVAFNVLKLPYPFWFTAANLACTPLAILWGLFSFHRPRANYANLTIDSSSDSI